MTRLIEKLIAAPSYKAGIYLILGALSQFLAPIADFIFVIALLMTADFITGIQAAKKRGEAITSQGWRRTATKIVVYSLLIIVCEEIKMIFFKDIDVKVTYAIALFIVMIELKSLSENIKTITGIDVWGKITEMFPSQTKEK